MAQPEMSEQDQVGWNEIRVPSLCSAAVAMDTRRVQYLEHVDSLWSMSV